MKSNIYESLGGAPALDAVVESFYRKVLSDDRVNYFFDDVDMEKQIVKQKAFLTMVLGGPHQYTGRDMRKSHTHLLQRGLNDQHVDIIISHIGETLAEFDVPKHLIKQVAEIANSTRDDVLNR